MYVIAVLQLVDHKPGLYVVFTQYKLPNTIFSKSQKEEIWWIEITPCLHDLYNDI